VKFFAKFGKVAVYSTKKGTKLSIPKAAKRSKSPRRPKKR
jgi:hypothetical protein